MKISEVMAKTGLSARAVRLYESRGLLPGVRRLDNDYRDYGKSDIERLCEIKRLRTVGISISDIRIYFEGILSLDEILKKRAAELKNESEKNSVTSGLLEQLISNPNKNFDNDFDETDSDETGIPDGKAVALGIDIGTTTLSFTVIGKGGLTESYTVSNSFSAAAKEPYFKEQNAVKTAEKAERVAEFVLSKHPEIGSVGITGQMHGILYLDSNGKAVSNLITWQDCRGDIPDKNGVTVCEQISKITGIPKSEIHTGYGLITHFYNMREGLVPQGAVTVATIGDYIAMQLTGVKKPIIHTSNAHSLGLFCAENGSFNFKATEKLGISREFLPEVTSENKIMGYYGKTPVTVAVGDNQAAFFGSVENEKNTVLVNYGTGSQVSAVSDKYQTCEGIEIRPYFDGKFLLSGSALCGGRAYAVLEKMFRSYVKECTGKNCSQYENMNSLAQKAVESTNGIEVSTVFCGTRADPTLRGAITGISEDNLLPENLIAGVLYGMANELYGFYKKFQIENIKSTVASGNAVRKNSAFRTVLSRVFGAELKIPKSCEEAALGAAVLSARSVRSLDENEIKAYYNYQ